MAISSIFNTLIFGGINSGDYGIYITGEAVYNAPQRAVNMVAVPGRNGAVAIDQGRWENITVTYPAGTFGGDQSSFSEKVSAFRNAIMSLRGYQRLSDTYHPDEYRMGLFMEAFEVKPVGYNEAGEFSIAFNCKPQRWLTSGETAVDVMGEAGPEYTVTGNPVSIDNPEGDAVVKSLTVEVAFTQSGSGTPSPDNARPISGRTAINTTVSQASSVVRTYNTSLGRTVYGCTVNIVSGLLTVDKAMITLDGSEDEAWSGANTRFAIIPDGIYASGSGRGEVWSNEFVYSSSATSVGTIFLLQSSGQVYVYPPVSDSLANFRTWLASNPLQIVYPLATPQTYQLTRTQVALLTGENTISSDGDMTVTYGADPSVLVNPTLFASSPLFKINGYGTVEFGEYEIEITNKALGYYELPSSAITTINRDYKLDLSTFEAGDTVNLSVEHWILVSCTSGFPTNSQGIGVSDPSTYYNRAFAAVTTTKDLSIDSSGTLPITVGTDATFSNVITVTFISGAIRPTIRITATTNYTASTGIISETAVVTSADSTYFSGSTISVDLFTLTSASGISSKSILGNVVVDCDLGVAYKEEDGTIVDLNGYIDLGSDLPTLAPGANEITADSTITSIEVTPRWWRL